MNTTPTVVVMKQRFLAALPSFRLFPLPLFHRDLTSFNPSIAAHDGKIYFAVRHANLLCTANDRYGFGFVLKDNARDFVNETSFGTLRIPEGPGAVECELFEPRTREFEDIRIFRHGGQWLGLGCVTERKVGTGFPEVGAVRIHLLVFDEKFQLAAAAPMPSPAEHKREKNWVPFARDGTLYLVYRPAPLELLTLDLDNKSLKRAARAAGAATSWSGGSQIVSYAPGIWLGLIHRRAYLAGEYVYEHAFLRIREDFSSEISAPFHFMSIGIEFCAGLVVRENDILMSFGSHTDSRSFVASISRADVETFF
jgi:hypothetical protein